MKPDQHLARLAARQYGLYTTDQALTAGLTSSALWRRRESGRVQRLEPEVYRAAGVPETWHQRLLIACLTEDAVASHRAAAALFALDGFPPRIVEVVTPRWKRRPNPSVRVHESTDLREAHRTKRCGIPVTTIERTLIDLGAVVPRIKVEQAFDEALRQGLTTPEAVRDRFSNWLDRAVGALVCCARCSNAGSAPRGPALESSSAGWGACSSTPACPSPSSSTSSVCLWGLCRPGRPCLSSAATRHRVRQRQVAQWPCPAPGRSRSPEPSCPRRLDHPSLHLGRPHRPAAPHRRPGALITRRQRVLTSVLA